MNTTLGDYATVLATLQDLPDRNMFADAIALERLRAITILGSQGNVAWRGTPYLAEDIIEKGRMAPSHPAAGLAALLAIRRDCQVDLIAMGERHKASREITQMGIALVSLIGSSP